VEAASLEVNDNFVDGKHIMRGSGLPAELIRHIGGQLCIVILTLLSSATLPLP
jgi:hypothetical protein